MSMIKQAGVVLAATAATLSTVAVVGATSASAAPCGYYREVGVAYYNHCATDTHVVVKVERKFPYKGYEDCFGPGIRKLGDSSMFVNAYYVGRLC